MVEKSCTRCGKCCLKAPCQIPVMHIDALRFILIQEFHKPKEINGLDIVEVMFRYKEDVLPSGQVSGFFLPLPKNGERCMWLKREGKLYRCTLFWNETAKHLVGFPEQVVGKGKGCTLDNPKQVPIIPMVYRNHGKYILSKKRAIRIPAS